MQLLRAQWPPESHAKSTGQASLAGVQAVGAQWWLAPQLSPTAQSPSVWHPGWHALVHRQGNGSQSVGGPPSGAAQSRSVTQGILARLQIPQVGSPGETQDRPDSQSDHCWHGPFRCRPASNAEEPPSPTVVPPVPPRPPVPGPAAPPAPKPPAPRDPPVPSPALPPVPAGLSPPTPLPLPLPGPTSPPVPPPPSVCALQPEARTMVADKSNEAQRMSARIQQLANQTAPAVFPLGRPARALPFSLKRRSPAFQVEWPQAVPVDPAQLASLRPASPLTAPESSRRRDVFRNARPPRRRTPKCR